MRTRRVTPRALATIAAVALALPASAMAANGGASAPSGGGQTATGGAPDDGVTLTGRRGVLVKKTLKLRGSAEGASGRTVTIEARSGAGAFEPVATAEVGPDGVFAARWKPARAGRFALRAVLRSASGDASASAHRTSAPRDLTVYRPARASWYGPGFYGNRTACGGRLKRSTLGVAHKRLPCGTKVAISYRKRSIVVPVIDRGPYSRGISYDLTEATARRLGVRATVRVGALRLSGY